METLINTSLVGNILLTLLGLLVVFHLLVIAGVIPYNVVWAGKINNRTQLIRMESFSLAVLMLAILLVALRMEYLTFLNYPAVVTGGYVGTLCPLFTQHFRKPDGKKSDRKIRFWYSDPTAIAMLLSVGY